MKIFKVEKINKIISSEVFLYAFFGGLTTIISIGFYGLFKYNGFNAVVSNTIATIIAVLFAYVTNKIWVFKSREYEFAKIIKEMLSFFAARLFTYILETALLFIFVDILGLSSLLKIFTTCLVIVLNYFLSKKAVFK